VPSYVLSRANRGEGEMFEESNPSFSYATTIQLPGTIGGHGDWVAYDANTQTMWLSQSPDNDVVVINAKTGSVEATIPGIDDSNGIAIAQGYAFVADPVNNVVDVIDTHTYQVVAKVAPTGTNLDGVVYAPNTGEIYVASDNNNVLDAISIQNGFTQTASYALTPSSTGPDVPLYAKGVIYVPDGQVVDAVDPATGAILNAPTLVSSGAVKPGVYDPVTNQFIFGSTGNELEVVSGNGPGGIGNVVGTIAVNGSTDEGAIDVKAGLAFFGSSTVGQVDVVNLNTMKLVATLPAETGTHTLNVDPQTHQLFVYEDDGNVVDVWHYTNAGQFQMTFAGSSEQYAASAGGNDSAAGNISDLLQSAGAGGMPAMGAAAGSAGAGRGAMQPQATTSASGLLATLDHGSAAHALMPVFGHGG
jgi:DNA-binding beta-propeller fold protein YncE